MSIEINGNEPREKNMSIRKVNAANVKSDTGVYNGSITFLHLPRWLCELTYFSHSVRFHLLQVPLVYRKHIRLRYTQVVYLQKMFTQVVVWPM